MVLYLGGLESPGAPEGSPEDTEGSPRGAETLSESSLLRGAKKSLLKFELGRIRGGGAIRAAECAVAQGRVLGGLVRSGLGLDWVWTGAAGDLGIPI